MSYTERFYDDIALGCQKSAAVVVPLVMDLLSPKTVIDVGCGGGWWGSEFARHGCGVVGIDGPWAPTDMPIAFGIVDLSEPIKMAGNFDLAVSLEVAEHLPPERAESFVADLCRLGRSVLFSAAQPGQEGEGHVNCQPLDYWADLFWEHGYGFTDPLRDVIWNDDEVEAWYKSNIVIFRGPTSAIHQLEIPITRWHPEMWRP